MARKSQPDDPGTVPPRGTPDPTISGEHVDLTGGFLGIDQNDVSVGVHEIQNTLTSAMFSIDLARSTGDTQEREQALNTIERAIQRARSMLISLGNPSQMFAVTNAPFSGHELVHEIAALLGPRCQAQGVLFTSAVSEVPPAIGDPNRVLQIITNFVLNALDAVQALGERLGDGSGRGRIHLTHSTSADGSPQWTVVDDGIGMSPTVLQRVFEPGFTTHPRREGARHSGHGIGMGLSRMLAQAMSGTVHVESEEGIGSKVTLILPRGTMQSAPVPAGERRVERVRSDDLPDGLRVLIVDDDRSIRDLMVTALGLRGATVYAANNSDAARTQIAQTGFDVALIDETLGASERGTALMLELLEQNHRSPVILMTGAPSVDHLPDSVSRFLLRKPFSLDEAVQAILRARDEER